MARTTSSAVQGVLLDDFGPRADGTTPSLTPFIDTATVIVDRVEACASAKGKALTAAELELIERWLAAHFYTQTDKAFNSKSTAGASATFHGQTAMHLDSSRYGQTARSLDYSGCLDAIAGSDRKTASGFWAGKAPSDQTDYVDRD